jgi:GTP-binding protein YchF
VEYLDISGLSGEAKPGQSMGDKTLTHIRPVEALVIVLRFFASSSMDAPDPLREYRQIEEEMILTDLVTVEKRLERITKELQRGKKDLEEEHELLERAKLLLDDGKPLRMSSSVVESEKMRGFAFLTAKPELVLLNAGEEKSREEIQDVLTRLRELSGDCQSVLIDWLYADTEAEIARLSSEEAAEFLAEMSLDEGAKDRIIKKSFTLLNLIVFLTAGEPEVRAWPLVKGKTALKAAGVIHSDIERGFIRAEIVAFDDFREHGSMVAASKAGRVRLEGKDYVIQDGDIVLFRFNV